MWQREKQAVLNAARKISDTGLVVGTSGNVSLRLPDSGGRSLMAVTPSSCSYQTLTADDIQVVDSDGRQVEGNLTPSIETPLHNGIYRARPDVIAVIHFHSIYASAVAVVGTEIPPILDDQVAFLGGEIKVAPHALSGSREQLADVIDALGDRSGVLMANHGAIGTGRTLEDAFTACQLIEKTAAVFLFAYAAGKVNRLPPPAVSVLRAIYDRINFGNPGQAMSDKPLWF